MYLHLVRTGTTLFARRALTSVFHRPKRCFKDPPSATGLCHEVALLAGSSFGIAVNLASREQRATVNRRGQVLIYFTRTSSCIRWHVQPDMFSMTVCAFSSISPYTIRRRIRHVSLKYLRGFQLLFIMLKDYNLILYSYLLVILR